MTFGAYIKELRNKAGLSQRKLEELAGISNAEISRIETGDRIKPSPLSIKALAPHLGVSYDELMQKAGYIEEVYSRGSFEDVVWKDSTGEPVDTFRRKILNIHQRDPDLITILDRAIDHSSNKDIDTIKKVLLGFMEGNLNEEQKNSINTILDGYLKKGK